MDHHAQRESGWKVEFLDDASVPLDAADQGTSRVGWRRLGRPSSFSVILSGGMAAGAVITIASVYMTQLTFRPYTGPDDPTYALNGFGHYHLVSHATSRFSINGHAPALGDVAIAGALVLLLAATISLLAQRGTLVSALTAGIACLAAGAIGAALACEAVEVGAFPNHIRAAGFWLFVVGACVAALAALVGAARAPRTDW